MQPHLLKLVSRLPRLLATLVVAPCLSFTAQAQISVGPTGSSTNRFDVAPPATEWSTAAIGANANEYTTVTALDIAIQQLAANSITAALPFTSSNPAPATNLVVWSSSGQYIQTTPSAVAANLLQATLRNDSGGRITFMILSYALTNANTPGAEEIPGHRLYYSLSGAPGSWTAKGTFFTQQSISLDLAGTPWPDGTLMYLLFVDDNSISNPDGFYQIDNFSIGAVVSVPPTCVGITGQPQSITVPEREAGIFSLVTTGTPQSIQWYRKDGAGSFNPIPGANANSYTLPATAFPGDNGAQFRAVITNSICTITSSIATLTVERAVFYESFELSEATDDWIANNGTWGLGIPTFGPPPNALGWRSYAGTNCAATVLGGNYADDTSSRLESKSFFVPPTAQNPRLRFWHWFSFSTHDFGRVQIQVGAGPWQNVSLNYVNTSGDVWTRTSIDLSSFKGQTIKIGFYFQSASSCCPTFQNVAAGWYIDEVTVISGPVPANNPETFETGIGEWSVESGSWEVGMPTSGPGTARSGTNCAATVLRGNYAEESDTRLISPRFIVPAAVDNPRLRFWHWFHFSTSDSGVVEIRAGTNAWESLSPGYVATGSGVWSQPSLDLSAFAGRTNVQIAFRFRSAGTCCPYNVNVAPGWYLDDVALATGPITVYTPEGFELGMGDWSADSGTWEIGRPTSGPNSAHAGTNCAATVLSGNYAEECDTRLVSPRFVIPPAVTNPRLRFYHWFNFSTADSGLVEIQSGNNNWQPLSSTFNGNSSAWTQTGFDLLAYAGQNVRLAFRFRSAGTCCPYNVNVAPGWYIDEVRLLHDFGLAIDSTVARTQQNVCVPISVAATGAVSSVGFVLDNSSPQGAAVGVISNLTITPAACWHVASLLELANSRWSVLLTNGCSTASMGVKPIANLCFDATSTQSGFAHWRITGLSATNQNASNPLAVARSFGGRAVIIGDQPLIEAWINTNGQRMVTTFGKPNTGYLIRYTNMLVCETNSPTGQCIVDASNWPIGMTNFVPGTMSFSQPLTGTLSNAPILFLDPKER